MCFDDEAGPPIPPMAGGAVEGGRLHLTSTDGTSFVAFMARAEATEPSGAAMIVLPDVRGLHRYYEELVLRFAEAGIDAIAIDYFGRTAADDDRTDRFPFMDHIAHVGYADLSADIEAAAAQLRSHGERRVFAIGFCFGGRLSLLTPTMLTIEVAGAIGFYGWPVGGGRGGVPAPADLATENRAPVLAIFGGADPGISSDTVATYEAALTKAGAVHEVVTYADAPHSFFDRRQADYADASADAWRRVLTFVNGDRATRQAS